MHDQDRKSSQSCQIIQSTAPIQQTKEKCFRDMVIEAIKAPSAPHPPTGKG